VESEIETYPFKADTIFLRDAAKYLAKVLDPGRGRRAAINRMDTRIRYAAKKGEFSIKRQGTRDTVSAKKVFTWAAHQAGWGHLYLVPGIPVEPASGNAEVSLPKLTASGEGFSMPVDRVELESQFKAAQIELVSARSQIERLTQKVEGLTAEIESWQAKSDHRSKVNSKNAKKLRPK
jgi:hypothetical protein